MTICSRPPERLADARASIREATDAVRTRALDLAAGEGLVDALEEAIVDGGWHRRAF